MCRNFIDEEKKWITDDNQKTLRLRHTTGANPIPIREVKATVTTTTNQRIKIFKKGITVFKIETIEITGFKTGMKETTGIKAKVTEIIEAAITVIKAVTIVSVENPAENLIRKTNFKARKAFSRKANRVVSHGKKTADRELFQICR